MDNLPSQTKAAAASLEGGRKTSLMMVDLKLLNPRVLLPWGEMQLGALLIEDGRIRGLVASPREASAIRARRDIDLDGQWVAPGFIDVQVNGGGGVLLNDDPTAGTMRRIAEAHREFGTTALLPTIISDRAQVSAAAIEGARIAVADANSGVIGLHLEGPFLAEPRRGIHDAAMFRPLTEDDIAMLVGSRLPSLLVTIAPEKVEDPVITRLADTGIKLALGHSEASFEEAKRAFAVGVTGVTHLYNAMPPLLSRAPGPVAAALESSAWLGIIADGHHVSAPALRTALRAKPDGRFMLVTDAMPPAGAEMTTFELGSKAIKVESGRLTSEGGTLAGSVLTMIDAVRYAVTELGLSLHHAVRLASYEPARFLGRSAEIGVIAPGRKADLVAISPQFHLSGVLTGPHNSGIFA